MRQSPFSFVLAGGVLEAVPRLAAELETRLSQVARDSTIRRLTDKPATGAVTLALSESRGDARLPTYLEP
jgi:hypothetical protein